MRSPSVRMQAVTPDPQLVTGTRELHYPPEATLPHPPPAWPPRVHELVLRQQDDMVRLCEKYPNAKWILAHCARSYSAWAIERAAKYLRDLPNVWYDTSSVCESDAMDALYSGVGSERVMYGSDDIPVGVLRGKYIAFGFAWAYLSESNHSLNLSHCEGQMTFTRYEQLRAMHRAARRLGMTRQQNEALFHDTAVKLIDSVRSGQPVRA